VERRRRFSQQRDHRNAAVSQRIAERQACVASNTRSATRLRAAGRLTAGRPLMVKMGLRLDRMISTRRTDGRVDSPRIRVAISERARVRMPTIVE
jgi:hypothetical protein